MFDNELKKRLLTTDPAQIGHFIEGGYMSPEIKPLFKEAKIAGPAYTVRAIGDDSTIVYYAMERAPKGSVIVIDRGGDKTFSCCGEIVALLAKEMGMEAIVVDGPATDSVAIGKMNFPVFASGLSPVTTRHVGLTGEINIPINCGGTVVNPGDIVFGDADGVIVINPELLEDLIEKAEKADKNEEEWIKAFKSGKIMSDFINITRLIENDTQGYINELKKV
ncbi:Regulator of RNase E activity RraA [Anaerosphaera aminiphila DSM 21120]|uniref:Putative 4-hydroxy-4-methyl-2-oxoglutarate aldolase n=1 Tax=Anaerosphaera aminiphila DSM 21120 TaxID=1120995 RepID=A0A1M5PML2_9FIRM|nr:RraA family protein [Anaerosphaera aminiphila]SHH02957.1 Regulator of RNase E activity RraA [Anaerosphaera aminiphila DSM 21120]